LYDVITFPPFAGADQETVSFCDPAVTEAVGIPTLFGTLVTVNANVSADAADVPEAFVAVTLNVYDAPDLRLPITIGEDAPDCDGPTCVVESPPAPVATKVDITV
jgi:hypothetical protein